MLWRGEMKVEGEGEMGGLLVSCLRRIPVNGMKGSGGKMDVA